MIAEQPFKVEDFRKRLEAMSDSKLMKTGQACASLADPAQAADRKTLRQVYVLQLKECRAEWKRRHPKEIYAKTNENKN